MTAESMDYTRVCSVIMPFGKKKVGVIAFGRLTD